MDRIEAPRGTAAGQAGQLSGAAPPGPPAPPALQGPTATAAMSGLPAMPQDVRQCITDWLRPRDLSALSQASKSLRDDAKPTLDSLRRVTDLLQRNLSTDEVHELLASLPRGVQADLLNHGRMGRRALRLLAASSEQAFERTVGAIEGLAPEFQRLPLSRLIGAAARIEQPAPRTRLMERCVDALVKLPDEPRASLLRIERLFEGLFEGLAHDPAATQRTIGRLDESIAALPTDSQLEVLASIAHRILPGSNPQANQAMFDLVIAAFDRLPPQRCELLLNELALGLQDLPADARAQAFERLDDVCLRLRGRGFEPADAGAIDYYMALAIPRLPLAQREQALHAALGKLEQLPLPDRADALRQLVSAVKTLPHTSSEAPQLSAFLAILQMAQSLPAQERNDLVAALQADALQHAGHWNPSARAQALHMTHPLPSPAA
jgi:hypothetical protein